MKKLRVNLFGKVQPKAEQSPLTIMIEVPADAVEFEHEGKRYRLTWEQVPVHEDEDPVHLADAVEM